MSSACHTDDAPVDGSPSSRTKRRNENVARRITLNSATSNTLPVNNDASPDDDDVVVDDAPAAADVDWRHDRAARRSVAPVNASRVNNDDVLARLVGGGRAGDDARNVVVDDATDDVA